MIKINVYRSGQAIAGFSVSGHANLAPHGQDIVCAGVSALTQAAVLGITNYLNKKANIEVLVGKLGVELEEPDGLTNAILETMLLGLMEIAKLYPKSVRIIEHRR